MAKRLNPRHQEMVREKIKASQIINRLQNHIDGEVELSSTQVRAAEVLLSKSVASVSQVDLSAQVDGELNITVGSFIEPADG